MQSNRARQRGVHLYPLLIVGSMACSSSGTGTDGGAGDAAALADGGSIAADGGPSALGAPGMTTRTLAAYPDRSYDVRIPSKYDGHIAMPVLINLHGGGGNRAVAHKTTCPNGDETSSQCLDPMADARGIIVVTPDGTGSPLNKNQRTWNAGGGANGWQCVSSYACNQKVDEAAYFTALLADLQTAVHFLPTRVYVTGFSNGAALAQRLVCEIPDLIYGAAPVSGGNQYSTNASCTAARPVVEIHGTTDPCWPYEGGAVSCADPNPGNKIAISDTMTKRLAMNGCTSTHVDTPMPDTTADGTTTVMHRYDCPAGKDVVFYEVTNGGHNWPDGFQFGSNGILAIDFSANKVILDFFAALP